MAALLVCSPAHAAQGDPPTADEVPFGGFGSGKRAPDGTCMDEHLRAPIIKAGREAEIVGLFSPHTTSAALAGHEGWTFTGIGVLRNALKATLTGPDAVATVTLSWVGCARHDQPRSASFAFDVTGAEGPTKTLVEAVTRNDKGGFWRSFSIPPGVRTARGKGPSTKSGGGDGASSVERLPFNESNAVVLVLLALCFLAWLIELPFLARELRLVGTPGTRATMLWLFGLTLGGLVLRYLADPTFIREAYVFPNVAWQVDDINIVLQAELGLYPSGPETLMHFIGPWFSDDPYRAWFLGRLHLGALTIPWAFVLGATLFKRRAAGLVFAATLTFLPHHVRISATEATHVDLVFFGTAAVALLLMAARNGRFTTFLAGATTAAATALMRPEAAMVLPGLLVVALATGDGIRKRWRHPAWIVTVAALVYMLYPSMLRILDDPSSENFAPGADDGSGLGIAAVGRTLLALVMPDGRNALFDPQIAPIWFYPLVIFGGVALWRAGQRWAAVGLGGLTLTFLFTYSGLPPAVTVWKHGRYHTSLLMGAVPLAAAGVWLLCARFERVRDETKRIYAATVLAVLGCAAWWPAMGTLDLEWQQGHHYVIELGQKYKQPLASARVIVPDNRRRFLDMSPRKDVVPLTLQKQSINNGVTVAHALEFFRTRRGTSPEAYYYEGLYCFLALGEGETINPQCDAMRKTFELIPMDTRTITAGAYLNMYEDWRAPPPITLGLYKVGRRKIEAEEALKMLPKPVGLDAKRELDIKGPYGHSTSPQLEPVEPSLQR